MIMQAYDFYYMNEKYGCNLQCGGDDQWSTSWRNKADTKKTGRDAYGLTINLLLTSEGKKMGKTSLGRYGSTPKRRARTIFTSTGGTLMTPTF